MTPVERRLEDDAVSSELTELEQRATEAIYAQFNEWFVSIPVAREVIALVAETIANNIEALPVPLYSGHGGSRDHYRSALQAAASVARQVAKS